MKVIIIGGGISGLSLAYFLLEKKPSLDVSVIESEKKAGGKIWTDRVDGYL
jgi:oxygen-dependent protoporphyrinogen oxidase